MPTNPHAPGHRRLKAIAHVTLKVIGGIVVLGLLTHMAWNLFAPDLFDLPRLTVKNALGLALMGGILASLLRWAVRGPGHGRPGGAAES